MQRRVGVTSIISRGDHGRALLALFRLVFITPSDRRPLRVE
jgi:hypothetical protein